MPHNVAATVASALSGVKFAERLNANNITAEIFTIVRVMPNGAVLRYTRFSNKAVMFTWLPLSQAAFQNPYVYYIVLRRRWLSARG